MVLDKVRKSKVHMKSKAFFAVRIAGIIFTSALVLLLSIFLASFIFFSIQESGQHFLLGFGGQGALVFLSLFPWAFFLLGIALLFLLEWLLQAFKFGYRIPLLPIFLFIFASSAILGVLANYTPLNRILLNRADEGVLPLIGGAYGRIRESHAEKGIFRGSVVSKEGNTIVISHDDKDHDEDDGTRKVILPPDSPLLKIGDKVYVFGPSFGEDDDEIEASGVRRFSSGESE